MSLNLFRVLGMRSDPKPFSQTSRWSQCADTDVPAGDFSHLASIAILLHKMTQMNVRAFLPMRRDRLGTFD
jgi:hypothetical protein